MQNPTFFNQIKIDLPLKNIYKRLGYRKGITLLPEIKRKEIERIINDALELLALRGCALIETVKKNAQTIYNENFSITSGILSSLLKESEEILFCAATSGEGIIKEMKNCSKNDLTRAVILDAVASEMTDSCFDWIINYYNRQLSREGKRLTNKRISCGYADFAIENQKKIYDLLDLGKLHIKITPQFMLVPEKSATAVLGIIKL